MKYEINVDESGKYINIVVIGDMTNENAMKMNIEASAVGAKNNIFNYLMDLTKSRNVQNAVENYNYAYRDMKQNEDKFDRRARVALLVAPDDNSHDFIVIVLVNTGLDVTKFTDRTEAIEFLKGN